MRILLISAMAALLLGGCQTSPRQNTDSRADIKTGVTEMSPAEVSDATDAAYSQLVDVREPSEYAVGHAYRAKNIPLSMLHGDLDNLERNEPVYVICETSNRSREAAKILQDAGFPRVVIVKGGTEAWRAAGLRMQ